MLSVISIYSNSILFFKSNSLKGSHSGQIGLPNTVNCFFIFHYLLSYLIVLLYHMEIY